MEKDMEKLARLLLTMLSVAVLDCWAADSENFPPVFQEIRIESHPKGWGFAYKTVKADSFVVGGHMSGGPQAPRVYESRSQATPDDMSALRELVAAIAKASEHEQPSVPDQNQEGYTSVVILFSDGSALTFVARWGQRFQPEAVQSIWDIVGKYKVGAW